MTYKGVLRYGPVDLEDIPISLSGFGDTVLYLEIHSFNEKLLEYIRRHTQFGTIWRLYDGEIKGVLSSEHFEGTTAEIACFEALSVSD